MSADRPLRLRAGDVVIVGPLPDPNSGRRAAEESVEYGKALDVLGGTHLPLVALVDMAQKPPTIQLVTPAEGALEAARRPYRLVHTQVNLRS